MKKLKGNSSNRTKRASYMSLILDPRYKTKGQPMKAVIRMIYVHLCDDNALYYDDIAGEMTVYRLRSITEWNYRVRLINV